MRLPNERRIVFFHGMKKLTSLLVLLVLFIFFALTLSAGTGPVDVGSTPEEVRAAWGEPQGIMGRGGNSIWQYPERTVRFTDGKVSLIQDRREEHLPNAAPRQEGNRRIPAVREIRNNGARIELRELAEPGKVTIVDFFADWCAPCRRISPVLESMAKSQEDVILRKVDIVNWQTPVVRQHNISSIPYIIVLDRNGRLVGQATSDPRVVDRNVKQALRR